MSTTSSRGKHGNESFFDKQEKETAFQSPDSLSPLYRDEQGAFIIVDHSQVSAETLRGYKT